MNTDRSACREFWRQARASIPELPATFSTRQIGTQPAVNSAILDAIRSGNKTGTVSIPDVYTQTGQTRPAVGDGIILLDADGHPAMAVQLTNVEDVRYSDIAEKHTALDGPRVRQLKVWQDTHHPWFNAQLAPFGLTCEDSTLIAFETFSVKFPTLGGR